MHRDPVVEEVRRHGARIAEECDVDIHRMAERFRREQAQHPQRVVRRGNRTMGRQHPPEQE